MAAIHLIQGISILINTSVPNNIAIVDPFGKLVAFLRMDNAFLGSIDISIKKAETSVLFNAIPNYALYKRAQPGGDLYGIEETNDVIVLFGGGQPIFDNKGYFIGAIGKLLPVWGCLRVVC